MSDLSEEKRMELLFELMRRPIPWDPIPLWIKMDDKMQRQFLQMEIRFKQKELEIEQEKMKEFGKIVGIG